MDDRHPDLEGLLRRTAHEPAAGPDPGDIARRARRRTAALRGLGLVAVVAVALGAGAVVAALAPTEGADVVFEGDAATETATPTPSPSPGRAAEPSPTARVPASPASPGPTVADRASPSPTPGETSAGEPPAPPERWVGVRESGDDLEVVLHVAGRERTLAVHARTSPEAPDAQATDVVLDAGGGTVLVGLCCEPVSGSFFVADLDDDGAPLEPVDIQGFRADLAEGLFAGTDTFGILGLRPSFPAADDQEIRDGASAADVGVEPGARARVAALVDPELASMPVPDSDARGVLVTERAADGTWHDEFVPLEARACALAFLAGGRVGLLRPDGDGGAAGDVLDCTGARVDVLDLEEGTVDDGVVTFPEPVRHLATDASGRHLIAAGGSGRVHWATLDGDGGELAAGGYVAADW